MRARRTAVTASSGRPRLRPGSETEPGLSVTVSHGAPPTTAPRPPAGGARPWRPAATALKPPAAPALSPRPPAPGPVARAPDSSARAGSDSGAARVGRRAARKDLDSESLDSEAASGLPLPRPVTWPGGWTPVARGARRVPRRRLAHLALVTDPPAQESLSLEAGGGSDPAQAGRAPGPGVTPPPGPGRRHPSPAGPGPGLSPTTVPGPAAAHVRLTIGRWPGPGPGLLAPLLSGTAWQSPGVRP